MLAEMMKTFPSTGSLNVTEFFHNEDNNRIFNDLITDLKKLGMRLYSSSLIIRPSYHYAFYVSIVRKNMDYTMLPLECLYLNKNALINVVGQPVSYNKNKLLILLFSC